MPIPVRVPVRPVFVPSLTHGLQDGREVPVTVGPGESALEQTCFLLQVPLSQLCGGSRHETAAREPWLGCAIVRVPQGSCEALGWWWLKAGDTTLTAALKPPRGTGTARVSAGVWEDPVSNP